MLASWRLPPSLSLSLSEKRNQEVDGERGAVVALWALKPESLSSFAQDGLADDVTRASGPSQRAAAVSTNSVCPQTRDGEARMDSIPSRTGVTATSKKAESRAKLTVFPVVDDDISRISAYPLFSLAPAATSFRREIQKQIVWRFFRRNKRTQPNYQTFPDIFDELCRLV